MFRPARQYEGIAVLVEAWRHGGVYPAEPIYPLGNAEATCQSLEGAAHRSVTPDNEAQPWYLSHRAFCCLEQVIDPLPCLETAEREKEQNRRWIALAGQPKTAPHRRDWG